MNSGNTKTAIAMSINKMIMKRRSRLTIFQTNQTASSVSTIPESSGWSKHGNQSGWQMNTYITTLLLVCSTHASAATPAKGDSTTAGNLSMRVVTFKAVPGTERTYYYHRDHLGSTTLITNKSGEVVQRVEYLPTGETFIEQQDTSWVSPHKFNGKELDEETGLYYYGARYYDPRQSMWLGTDPMQGKYPGISTYCYTVGNPVKFIDPDGREKLQGLNKSRDRLLWTDYNSFIDDPNTIHIWGHGNGTGIYLNNVFYDSAKSINNFLNENSTVWKSRSNNPVLIVLHSCYDASFAQKLSNNPIFKDVLVVGPTDKIRVEGLEVNDTNPILLESYVVNKGKWIGYRNGKYERSWDSYEKPGSLEPYKYSDAKKDFDKIMDKYGIKTSIENIIKNKYHAKDF